MDPGRPARRKRLPVEAARSLPLVAGRPGGGGGRCFRRRAGPPRRGLRRRQRRREEEARGEGQQQPLRKPPEAPSSPEEEDPAGRAPRDPDRDDRLEARALHAPGHLLEEAQDLRHRDVDRRRDHHRHALRAGGGRRRHGRPRRRGWDRIRDRRRRRHRSGGFGVRRSHRRDGLLLLPARAELPGGAFLGRRWPSKRRGAGFALVQPSLQQLAQLVAS
mmetsp:Transcript_18900/g.43826  ORF Transcript_18900/g.43826 Transcript_18900/m.43826 type:complete len:218 (+) Transcript_18900:1896-2549(+)